MWCGVVWCSRVWCSVVCRGVMWCGVGWCALPAACLYALLLCVRTLRTACHTSDRCSLLLASAVSCFCGEASSLTSRAAPVPNICRIQSGEKCMSSAYQILPTASTTLRRPLLSLRASPCSSPGHPTCEMTSSSITMTAPRATSPAAAAAIRYEFSLPTAQQVHE